MQAVAVDQVVVYTEKRCPSCPANGRPELQPLTQFNRNARRKDGLDSRCRECRRAESKAILARRRVQPTEPVPRSTLYARLMQRQQGRCAVCRLPERQCREGKPIRLSYHRLEGRARVVESLLCTGCVIAIHAVQSDAARALQVSSYLLAADRWEESTTTAVIERGT
jgi:hypothetical protein